MSRRIWRKSGTIVGLMVKSRYEWCERSGGEDDRRTRGLEDAGNMSNRHSTSSSQVLGDRRTWLINY